jgi:all-trans-retinol 13,14-reductase
MTGNLYQRFDPKFDFSGIDHIIVGSGIGGLTVATWLAKAGKKVLVFERHYVPGGFTHSFKRRQGFQWDVGVHYVGKVGRNGDLRKLFDFLTDYKLDWESMGEVYDVVNIDGKKYEFKAGEAKLRKQLINYFPEDAEAINAYLKLIKKANNFGSAFFFEKTFKPFLSVSIGWLIRKLYARFSQKTTYEVLSELTDNKRLIAVLCAQCGNYGLTPKYSSFAAHAMVIGHFMEGGYYPKGGAGQICEKTIKVLNDHGGKVFINAEVKEIVIEKNRVKGVRIDDTFIPCSSVISNVGVNNTFNYLLSEKDKKRCKFDLQKVKSSSGHMCLYVGLDRSDAELNLPKHNVWNFANDKLDEVLDHATLKDAAQQFSYISFPSAKDPEWQKNNPEKATIQALSVARYDWFSKYEKLPWMKRGKIYSALKKDFEQSMLAKLYELFPQIKGHIVVTEVSSPLSTKNFTNYKNGEIYGLEHTPKRFTLPFLRPETKIKGLRLVGQDITLVGVAGAMLSGMLCAITILKFGVWWHFREMGKSQAKNELKKTNPIVRTEEVS